MRCQGGNGTVGYFLQAVNKDISCLAVQDTVSCQIDLYEIGGLNIPMTIHIECMSPATTLLWIYVLSCASGVGSPTNHPGSTQTEVECIFRALQGPLNLHCIQIRAAAVRTPNTLIRYTDKTRGQGSFGPLIGGLNLT